MKETEFLVFRQMFAIEDGIRGCDHLLFVASGVGASLENSHLIVNENTDYGWLARTANEFMLLALPNNPGKPRHHEQTG